MFLTYWCITFFIFFWGFYQEGGLPAGGDGVMGHAIYRMGLLSLFFLMEY